MMRLLLTLLCLASIAAIPARAETARLALVIGNGGYASPGVPALRNPPTDSALIADRLRETGFTVTHIVDADLEQMKQGIADFGRALREGGRDATGLFYYAGHAVQSFGTNFLLPVDTALADPADLALVALEAEAVLRQMSSAQNRTNIVILDACRNNPFDAMAEFGTNGLAEMRAPTGTFLSYATAPGDVAVDGTGDNSPFTAALAREMMTPGRPIEEVFRQVRVAVIEATLGRQTPWDTSSLTRAFTFVDPAPSGVQTEADAFAAAQAHGTAAAWQAFLEAFPNSIFADAARLQQEAARHAENARATPPVAAASEPAADPVETSWETARSTRDPERIARFLAEHGDSRFARAAEALLTEILMAPPRDETAVAALAEANRALSIADAGAGEADADGASRPRQDVARASDPRADGPVRAPGPLTIATPLVDVDPSIRGKTIAEVIATAAPLFPPVDGLPDAYWSGQGCGNCHQWEPAALCTQAQTYLAKSVAETQAKPHPLGGSFKLSLRQWAQEGCL